MENSGNSNRRSCTNPNDRKAWKLCTRDFENKLSKLVWVSPTKIDALQISNKATFLFTFIVETVQGRWATSPNGKAAKPAIVSYEHLCTR